MFVRPMPATLMPDTRFVPPCTARKKAWFTMLLLIWTPPASNSVPMLLTQ